MFKLILGLLFSFPTLIYAQNSVIVRVEIDSTLSIKLKLSRRVINSEFDSVKYSVLYDKKTNAVVCIDEVHYPVGGKTRWWIYRYHFRQDTIMLISKYNNVKRKDPRWQNAYYYFRNNVLVFTEETGTSIPDIPAALKRSEYLRSKFSTH